MCTFYHRFRAPLIVLGAVLVGIGISGAIVVLGRHSISPQTSVDTHGPPARRSTAPGETRAAFATLTFESILNRVSNEVVAAYYAGNHNILVLDFPSLWHQARALNRVAALIEKRGAPRDRILSEEELLSYAAAHGIPYKTFYFGHNYTASDLAKFFNLAEAQELSLNHSEDQLLRLLLDNGFVQLKLGQYRSDPPVKALISLVQTSTGEEEDSDEPYIDLALRETVFLHELSHGEFHTNDLYRNHSVRFWQDSMTDTERVAFTKFLARNYDFTNEELMINEAQAFLAHTPDPRAFNAAMVGLSGQTLGRLRERFWLGLELQNDSMRR